MNDISALVKNYKQWLRETNNRDELYKWEATKLFQDNWDIDAPNFYAMIKKANAKSGNLLYMLARSHVMTAAKYFPDRTREIFRNLFDESRDLKGRMTEYLSAMAALQPELEAITSKPQNPYQDERTIAYFLAMRYPDRHYLYKDSYYRKTCEVLGIPAAKAGEKYLHFLKIAEDIKQTYIEHDTELLALHEKARTPNCYSGDELNLILQNFLYVAVQGKAESALSAISPDAAWWVYVPGKNAMYWDTYSDEGIMGLGWGELGDLSAYPTLESIMAKFRELTGDQTANFKNDSLTCWEFANVLKIGDVIIPKRGASEYLGYGIVDSDYRWESARGEYSNIRTVRWIKQGSFPENNGPIVQKTLTNITQDKEYVAKLRAFIVEGATMPEPTNESKPDAIDSRPRNYILYGPPGTGKTWSSASFALSLTEHRDFESYASESPDELRRRYQLLVDAGRVEFVTFHQSFSYEEFIEGIRPKVQGEGLTYSIEDGVFKVFCDKARADSKNDYIFIIDEINRGNVARVFGELITLIESDKREGSPYASSSRLPYSRTMFSVPANVFLVGTMNTADRSVEALDTALRRRFSFKEMPPRPALLAEGEFAVPELALNLILETINRRIARLLDRDHQIGHSYFLNIHAADDPLAALRVAFRDNILPLLKEYFYNDPVKIGLVLGKAFVHPAAEKLRLASFDEEMEDRYEDKQDYVFSSPEEWNEEAFASIYEDPQN
ncbi:MAG: AAA family ATPase [Rectinema sp.]